MPAPLRRTIAIIGEEVVLLKIGEVVVLKVA